MSAAPAGLAGQQVSARPAARRAPAPGRGALRQAARFEAVRLLRNPLVLAAVLASAAFIWWNNFRQVPLWWVADVGIGTGMLLLAGGVLIAAQLAAGRASRDGMTGLYDSFPATAAVRRGGLLLGLGAPVLTAAVVTAAAAGWLEAEGAAGSPRPAVLAGGLLLVALGGAVGAAVGSWRAHPLLGILIALLLALPEWDVVSAFDGWFQLTGPNIWLMPWTWNSVVLGSLPGNVLPVPPATHLAELAALTGLAALAALGRTRSRRGLTAGLAAALLAVLAWSGWMQDRPVPVSAVARLVYQVTHPVSSQRCTTAGGVRYCYYPAFARMVGRWEIPVNGVLALLPHQVRHQAGRPLVIRQLDEDLLLFPPLGPMTPRNPAARQVLTLGARADNFGTAAGSDPGLIAGASRPPVYTGLGWGLGSQLGSSQAGLASQVADWAVGLPTTAPMVTVKYAGGSSTEALPCVPLGQAREAIAIWLAASATTDGRAQFRPPGQGAPLVEVGTTWIYDAGWTNQGLALADEMLALRPATVQRVLAARWADWVRPAATDAQLAAALGVRSPALQRGPTPRPDGQLPGTNEYVSVGPPSPVCR